MEFSLLDDELLVRYKRTYKLRTRTNSSRDELLNVVMKHYNSIEVPEKEVITQFIYATRNQGKKEKEIK